MITSSAIKTISVILPVYNTELYIKEAIDSVLAQSFTDFELIIINDASTDRTCEILKSLEDSRIRLINNETNLGLSKNFNKGIELANGKYIARMDADDICHPERFKTQINFFENNPDIDFCATWVQFFGHENRILRTYLNHEDIKADLFFINNIIHPSVMFKREKLIQYHLCYDENLYLLEDYTLWLDAIDSGLKFATIPQVLLKYRIHGENFSLIKKDNRKILNDGHYRIYERFYKILHLKYLQQDLEVHRKLGLRNTEKINAKELEPYLLFLKKIIKANNEVGYINRRAFKNFIFSCFSLLLQKTNVTLYPSIIKTLIGLYSPVDFLDFVKFKLSIKKIAVNTF